MKKHHRTHARGPFLARHRRRGRHAGPGRGLRRQERPAGTPPTLSPTRSSSSSASSTSTTPGEVMLKQVYGWGVAQLRPLVQPDGRRHGGLAGHHRRPRRRDEGDRPRARRGAGGGYTGGFPIDGWEDLGSSATVVSPYHWTIAPVHQAYKGAGTGPGGVTARARRRGQRPLGRLREGRRHQRQDHPAASRRPDVLRRPVASPRPKARGAVGALMDYPSHGQDDPEDRRDRRVRPDPLHPPDRVEQAGGRPEGRQEARR